MEAMDRRMNVFVLSTGRSGTTTFIKACQHISNFTAGHETQWRTLGNDRLNYPPDHIEADNRLTWFLGRLDDGYGKDAFYVHLIRDKEATSKSFEKRYTHSRSILRAYVHGILALSPKEVEEQVIRESTKDYWETVNANIRLFLKDKPRQMTIHLESIKEAFPEFWETIGANGDLSKAMAEFDVKHNASGNKKRVGPIVKVKRRLVRYTKKLWGYSGSFR